MAANTFVLLAVIIALAATLVVSVPPEENEPKGTAKEDIAETSAIFNIPGCIMRVVSENYQKALKSGVCKIADITKKTGNIAEIDQKYLEMVKIDVKMRLFSLEFEITDSKEMCAYTSALATAIQLFSNADSELNAAETYFDECIDIKAKVAIAAFADDLGDKMEEKSKSGIPVIPIGENVEDPTAPKSSTTVVFAETSSDASNHRQNVQQMLRQVWQQDEGRLKQFQEVISQYLAADYDCEDGECSRFTSEKTKKEEEMFPGSEFTLLELMERHKGAKDVIFSLHKMAHSAIGSFIKRIAHFLQAINLAHETCVLYDNYEMNTHFSVPPFFAMKVKDFYSACAVLVAIPISLDSDAALDRARDKALAKTEGTTSLLETSSQLHARIQAELNSKVKLFVLSSLAHKVKEIAKAIVSIPGRILMYGGTLKADTHCTVQTMEGEKQILEKKDLNKLNVGFELDIFFPLQTRIPIDLPNFKIKVRNTFGACKRVESAQKLISGETATEFHNVVKMVRGKIHQVFGKPADATDKKPADAAEKNPADAVETNPIETAEKSPTDAAAAKPRRWWQMSKKKPANADATDQKPLAPSRWKRFVESKPVVAAGTTVRRVIRFAGYVAHKLKVVLKFVLKEIEHIAIYLLGPPLRALGSIYASLATSSTACKHFLLSDGTSSKGVSFNFVFPPPPMRQIIAAQIQGAYSGCTVGHAFKKVTKSIFHQLDFTKTKSDAKTGADAKDKVGADTNADAAAKGKTDAAAKDKVDVDANADAAAKGKANAAAKTEATVKTEVNADGVKKEPVVTTKTRWESEV